MPTIFKVNTQTVHQIQGKFRQREQTITSLTAIPLFINRFHHRVIEAARELLGASALIWPEEKQGLYK